jgi:ribonuclease BN (tRNA processing enzyme)
VFRRAGARRLLLTHRPAELPTPDGLEVAYDGFELDL